jgi:hypothetical protein
MRRIVICLSASVALALPVAALAQSTDAQYCQKLADLYRTTNKENMDASAPEAMNQCKQGNTAAGIPVLEKLLKESKVTLPAR